MAALSFDFVTSHADSTRLAPRARRELGFRDTTIVIVFFAFILVSLYVGNQLGGIVTHLFPQLPRLATPFVLAIALGVFGWSLLGIPWVKRQQMLRLRRFCPELQTRVTVDEEGIRIIDEHSDTFWRWTRIHRAVSIPDGVLILSGPTVILVPARALGGGQQAGLVDYVNAHAASRIANPAG